MVYLAGVYFFVLVEEFFKGWEIVGLGIKVIDMVILFVCFVDFYIYFWMSEVMKIVFFNLSRFDVYYIEYFVKGFRGGCSTGVGRICYCNNWMFG